MTGDSEEPRSKYTFLSLSVRGKRSGIPSPCALEMQTHRALR